MARNERVTIAVIIALAILFAVMLASGTADSLNALSWFGSGANVIQWTSGIGLIVGIATAASMHYSRTCAAYWYCLRQGQHPVDGTLEKVCRWHHTIVQHEAVYAAHGERHARSARLDLGQSHELRPPS